MNVFLEKNFIRLYWLLCGIVFVVVALRAFFIPFSHDEASTFFFYVQSDNYMPYKAHVYTNNHVLNSALSNICYHLGGSHRFVLRLPNLLAFLVLCFGVYRFFAHLKRYSSKILLVAFMLLTFNFLDFFELCRGYGLSMAFLVLGLSYLQTYFTQKTFLSLVLFSFCLQTALAANLIFVAILSLLLLFLYVFQLKVRTFLSFKNVLLQGANLYLLYKWIKFSFYYKKEGVLDSGAGDNYWKTSFVSLIDMIYGSQAIWIQGLVILFFVLSLGTALFLLYKNSFSLTSVYGNGTLYVFALTALILGFYLQRLLLGVNYPEDRTGLFFYVFFALALVYSSENWQSGISTAISALLTISCSVHFVLAFNLKSFTHYFYHVIPKEVYEYLLKEYEKQGQSFTIGGNITREMDYAFLNYRGGGVLNPMRISPVMSMNCDYYFASKHEEPFYRGYYDEVVEDEVWNRVLLKRKEPIHRQPLVALSETPRYYSGTEAFYEFLRLKDTLYKAGTCVEAECALFFKKVPKPFRAFLVLSADNAEGETVYYERALLNWLEDDLNGKSRTIRLTTGALPEDIKSVYVYLWNIEQKPLDFSVVKLNLYELQGKGVNYAAPAAYYPALESLTKKPIL